MAAAFTGWNFAGNDTSNAADLRSGEGELAASRWCPWEMQHDTGAKTLFDGIVLPAGPGRAART